MSTENKAMTMLTARPIGSIIIRGEKCVQAVANTSRGDSLHLERNEIFVFEVRIIRVENRSIWGFKIRGRVRNAGSNVSGRTGISGRLISQGQVNKGSLNCRSSGTWTREFGIGHLRITNQTL